MYPSNAFKIALVLAAAGKTISQTFLRFPDNVFFPNSKVAVGSAIRCYNTAASSSLKEEKTCESGIVNCRTR